MLALHTNTGCLGDNVTLDSVMHVVREKMDAASFKSWIAPLTGAVNDGVLSLCAANQFSVDFINRTFKHFLTDAAASFGLSVVLVVKNAPVASVVSVNDNAPKQNWTAAAAGPEKNGVSFDDFILSDENMFAVNACKKVAAGAVTFSPLFLYGASGCGKSLLTDAVAHNAAGRTVSMTGSQFVSEFLRAMNDKNTFAFKDYVRNCDTFILDDVQAIAGKRATADEFITTVHDLIRMGKNVVITSTVAPAQLTGFERNAQSILASGLSIDLALPNKAVRRAMLMRAGVSATIAETIADRVSGDGHIIAGFAKKMSAYADLMGGGISLDVAQRLLADAIGAQKTPLVMVKTMAATMGISLDDVASSRRSRPIVRARQIMMAALKAATKLSLSDIGTLLGDRDHATVLYGLAQIDKLKQTDLILNAEIDQMIAICK